MDQASVTQLFDYLYWSRDRILAMAALVPAELLTTAEPVTSRDLRATLVHELDVEWSWRLRLRGETTEAWGPEAELLPEEFPTVASIAARWHEDEVEMRSWLAGLTTDELAASPPTESGNAHSLSSYLLHVIVHGIQQLEDAGVLLTVLGHSPGDVEFLDYAETAARNR